MTEVANYDKDQECIYNIEERIMTIKKTNVKQQLYVQKKKDKFDKSALEKMENWTKKVKADDKFSSSKPNRFKEGICFDQANIESTVKQRLLLSTEKLLRQKFEKEQKELEKNQEQQQEEVQRVFRVKVPNVMFFEEDVDKQKEKLSKIVNDIANQLEKEFPDTLENGRLRYNKMSFFRHDRKTNKLLDYLLLIFNGEKVAKRFCDLIDGKKFNSVLLKADILPPRKN